jgi:hypothetical protein
MTTTSSIRTIQSRLSNSTNSQTMANNAYELKSSRVCVKKPLNGSRFFSNRSTAANGLTNQFKKRTLQLNNFFLSKSKSNEHNNGQTLSKQPVQLVISTSAPLIFHSMPLSSIDDTNDSVTYINGEQQVRCCVH